MQCLCWHIAVPGKHQFTCYQTAAKCDSTDTKACRNDAATVLQTNAHLWTELTGISVTFFTVCWKRLLRNAVFFDCLCHFISDYWASKARWIVTGEWEWSGLDPVAVKSRFHSEGTEENHEPGVPPRFEDETSQWLSRMLKLCSSAPFHVIWPTWRVLLCNDVLLLNDMWNP